MNHRDTPSVDASNPHLDEAQELEELMASLFADTRQDPSTVALSRLAEKAKDVPGQASARWWRWLSSPIAFSAVVAAAASVLVFLSVASPDSTESRLPPPSVEVAGVLAPLDAESSVAPVSPKAAHAPETTVVTPDSAESPEVAVAEFIPVESSDPADDLSMLDDDVALDFGLLDLPDDDESADALLDAYDRELGDG